MAWKLSLEDVKVLLQSRELAQIEKEIAEPEGADILPLPSVIPLFGDLALAGLTKEEFQRLLIDDAKVLIQLGIAIQSLPDLDEQEYDQREEPEPAGVTQNIKTLGYGNGFALTYACYLSFLKRKDIAGLVRFLKARRIPKARRFAAQLEGVYEQVSRALKGL